MQDRFKFRAVLKTDRFTILVEPFYILDSCYFIDINKAEVEFECKYSDECFWDFVEEIKKQDYIQEISVDSDLIITKDFTNLIQCTGLKDKYGKLIFEKDIVKFKFDNDEIIGVIEWSKIDPIGWYINTTDYFGNKYVTDYDFLFEDYEIIGNIYENHKLLEK